MSLWQDLLSGGLIGATGDIAGSIIGSVAGGIQARKEREWNAAEAEKNRNFQNREAEELRDWQRQERLDTQAWNEEMWNKQNEYNSPAEQLKRAQAAGINPNAAVQGISGSSTAGSLQSSPQAGAMPSGSQSAPAPNFSNTLAELLGNSMQNAWTNAESMAKTVAQNKTNRVLDKQLAVQTDKMIADWKGQLLKNDETAANTDYIKSATDYMDADYKRLVQMTPHEVQAAALSVNKIVADIANVNADTTLKETENMVAGEQILTEQLKQQNISADTQKKYQDILEGKARIENLSYQNSALVAQAAQSYAAANNLDANTVLAQLEQNVAALKAEAANNGVLWDANEIVGGLIYTMSTGDDASAYYQPVMDYKEGIIKAEGKQTRRNAWNQAAANTVENVVSAIPKLITKK